MANQPSTQDESIIQIPRADYDIMRAHLFALEAYAKSVSDRYPDFTPAVMLHNLAVQATYMGEGSILNVIPWAQDAPAPMVAS